MTKGQINEFFVQYLHKMTTGRKLSVPMWKIVNAILYKLKTGLQWRELPMRQFFGFARYTWQSVFYHFNKWSKTGMWQQAYSRMLKENRMYLNLSSINLDGTHTPVKRGGEQVGYQGRKKTVTTNLLIITDDQGVPIGWSKPISGDHHDSYELEKIASEIFSQMEEVGLPCEGLFLNADSGFDVTKFKELCFQKGIIHNIDENKRRGVKGDKETSYVFDNELYKRRFVVEQLNAWVDGFKTLVIRYETTAVNWMSFHCLAFAIIFLRKFRNVNI
jgi:transposase